MNPTEQRNSFVSVILCVTDFDPISFGQTLVLFDNDTLGPFQIFLSLFFISLQFLVLLVVFVLLALPDFLDFFELRSSSQLVLAFTAFWSILEDCWEGFLSREFRESQSLQNAFEWLFHSAISAVVASIFVRCVDAILWKILNRMSVNRMICMHTDGIKEAQFFYSINVYAFQKIECEFT